MHVISPDQFKTMLRVGPNTPRFRNCLDIGAGDGNVSRVLTQFVEDMVCTEISKPMLRQLRAGGFRYV
jgi:predicted TPR repeat methyltransferase